MPAIQEHSGYHEGFCDAQDGDPLFDDAAPEYRAGWQAFHDCRRMLEEAGFSRTSPHRFSKTIVVERPL